MPTCQGPTLFLCPLVTAAVRFPQITNSGSSKPSLRRAPSPALASESDKASAMLPPLVDDLVEEVLLRFPPEDPAALVRAALVCKRWRRLVSNPGFRRRFCEFHRNPPMLGMFCGGCGHVCRQFVPTTAFRPRHAERAHAHLLDARHGRVLLLGQGKALVVWDPITDEEWKVPFPRVPPQYTASLSWAAAVLCSAAEAGGCDHLDCHRRPFIVVFVRSVFGDPGVEDTVICTYTSDAAAWSEPTCSPQPDYEFSPYMRSALVGNTLYFVITNQRTALKYNVQSRQMSLYRSTLRATTEDGGLLLATEHTSKLYVWSRKDATWELSRVIELKMLLPVDIDFTSLVVVGSTEDLGIIFMRAGDVVHAIDLKTYKGKKVYKGRVKAIVPFMSFYIPELEAAYVDERPSEGGSSA